jgi:hypothetical protein
LSQQAGSDKQVATMTLVSNDTSLALALPVNPSTAVSFGIGMDHDGLPILPVLSISSDPPSFRSFRSSPIRQTFRCPIPQSASEFSCVENFARRANFIITLDSDTLEYSDLSELSFYTRAGR